MTAFERSDREFRGRMVGKSLAVFDVWTGQTRLISPVGGIVLETLATGPADHEALLQAVRQAWRPDDPGPTEAGPIPTVADGTEPTAEIAGASLPEQALRTALEEGLAALLGAGLIRRAGDRSEAQTEVQAEAQTEVWADGSPGRRP